MTLFRPLALTLLALSLGACGGADAVAGPPAPSQGAVQFKVDALTCVGSATIDFYLDGSVIGTETLSAGGSASKQYPTSAGQHVLGAAVSNTRSYVWPSANAIVPVNATFIAILKC
jgi:hypothetical protein